MSAIPFVNLKRQIDSIRGEIDAAIAGVIDSNAFINGPQVAAFENEFISAQGGFFGHGCANGTAALHLALELAGVGPGDEVIVPAHSFVATAEAVIHAGATPVFADIRPSDYTLDPDRLSPGPRTRAIMPVHIYGTAADVDGIRAVTDTYHLTLIEDAAQAHLATLDRRGLGTIGDFGCFSFYPGKNLGAFGDAGFVMTRDEDQARRLRMLLDHGRISKYEHTQVGYNYRLDTLQAAILSAKLPHLAEWTRQRRAIAAHYDGRLKQAGFKTIEPMKGANPCYHLYVVEVSNREEVMKHLSAKGVGHGVHYPVPLHLQPCFKELGYRKGDLPVTERTSERVLSLPMCGSTTLDEAEKAVEAFLEVARP